MTEGDFVALRTERWKRIERRLGARSRRGRSADRMEASAFPAAYRGVCRDLNRARAEHYSTELIERLNRMVWLGHRLIYGNNRFSWRRAVSFFTVEFPAAVRRYAKWVLLCFLLFYGTAALTYLYVGPSRARADFVLGKDGAQSILEMYDPSATHFLKPRDATTDADMFGYYIQNNVSIGFKTFAGGALAGLGSLLVLVSNAIILGGAAALVHAAGYSATFFPFVVGHAAFELTAIIMFALCGFMLGRALIMPGRLTRAEALRRASRDVLPIVVGSAFFLFIAACIEAFWSSRMTAISTKVEVAAVLWVGVVLFFVFGGRGAGR